MEQNLRRAQEKWGLLVNLLSREGADRRTTGFLNVELVKAVLLFGSETWVMTPELEKYINDFRHRAVRRMAGMGTKCKLDGTWMYPPIGSALVTVGLNKIGVYISPCQNIVAQYIATHPIVDLCLLTYHNTGLRLSRRWWENPALGILGIRSGRAEVGGGGYMVIGGRWRGILGK